MGTLTLHYLEPAEIVISGVPSDAMIVRAATGRALGRLRGFVVDPLNRHLRYFVVRASGLFGKTTLVPAVSPRVDVKRRSIDTDVNDEELSLLRNFTLQKALVSRVCERVKAFPGTGLRIITVE